MDLDAGHGFAGVIGQNPCDTKVAVVGDENLSVLTPVARDLIARGGDERVVLGGLGLDRAACGLLSRYEPLVLDSLELILCK